MSNNITEIIIDQLLLIESKVKNGDSLELRKQINALERIVSRFFKKSSYEEYLQDADDENEDLITDSYNAIDSDIKHVRSLIMLVITNMTIEIKIFGLPSKEDAKIDKSVTINNQHTINQSVKIDLFKEVLTDSLTGRQFRELSEIAQSEPNAEQAKPKLIDKIKSFGGDVASNILANILTNPNIYTGLF